MEDCKNLKIEDITPYHADGDISSIYKFLQSSILIPL